MIRRLSILALSGSVIALAAVALVTVRARWAGDHFHLVHYSSSARTFRDARFGWNDDQLYARSELTAVVSAQDVINAQAHLEPSADTRLSHATVGVFPPSRSPVFWFQRFRVTPSSGINPNGLADCWNLETRLSLLLCVCALPLSAVLVRLAWRRFRATGRGFAVKAIEPEKLA